MEAPKPKDSNIWATVMIAAALIGCVGVIGAAFINKLPEILGVASNTQSAPTNVVVPISAPTENLAATIPASVPASPTIIANSSDTRDIAAQALGYANLDDFMSAFGIPPEVKSRIFVCPNEESWCLGVYEEPGQPDFHFKNITNCVLDGKQANGTSTIPSGFDGMVKGFTVRPCSR